WLRWHDAVLARCSGETAEEVNRPRPGPLSERPRPTRNQSEQPVMSEHFNSDDAYAGAAEGARQTGFRFLRIALWFFLGGSAVAAVFISNAFAVGAAHPRIVEILVEVGVGILALAFMFSVKALGMMSREFSKARRIRNTTPRRAAEGEQP